MASIAGLSELIRTPFMLKIIVDVLPDILRQRDESSLSEGQGVTQIRRLDLYQAFIQQWFDREAAKCTKEDLSNATGHSPTVHYHFQVGEPLQKDYQELCEDFAVYLMRENQLTAVYQRHWEIGGKNKQIKPHALDHFFNDHDPAVRLVRKGCPLQRQGTRYGFLHKSLWEYFIAMRIYQEIQLSVIPWHVKKTREIESTTIDEKKKELMPQKIPTLKISQAIHLKNRAKKTCYRLADRRAAQPVVMTLSDQNPEFLLINKKLLLSEPSIVRFLAELAQQDMQFRKNLLYWVRSSSLNERITIASVNAITILNVARLPFSGINLSRVRIPGADLSHALLDGANFSGADLKNVRFHQAFMRDTILKGADVRGAFFEAAALYGQDVDIPQQFVFPSPAENLWFCFNQSQKKIQIYDLTESRFWTDEIDNAIGYNTIKVTDDGSLAFLMGVKGQVGVYDISAKKLLEPLASEGSSGNISLAPTNSEANLAIFDAWAATGSYQVYDISNKKLFDKIDCKKEHYTAKAHLTVTGNLLFFFKGKKSLPLVRLPPMLPPPSLSPPPPHLLSRVAPPPLSRTIIPHSSRTSPPPPSLLFTTPIAPEDNSPLVLEIYDLIKKDWLVPLLLEQSVRQVTYKSQFTDIAFTLNLISATEDEGDPEKLAREKILGSLPSEKQLALFHQEDGWFAYGYNPQSELKKVSLTSTGLTFSTTLQLTWAQKRHLSAQISRKLNYIPLVFIFAAKDRAVSKLTMHDKKGNLYIYDESLRKVITSTKYDKECSVFASLLDCSVLLFFNPWYSYDKIDTVIKIYNQEKDKWTDLPKFDEKERINTLQIVDKTRIAFIYSMDNYSRQNEVKKNATKLYVYDIHEDKFLNDILAPDNSRLESLTIFDDKVFLLWNNSQVQMYDTQEKKLINLINNGKNIINKVNGLHRKENLIFFYGGNVVFAYDFIRGKLTQFQQPDAIVQLIFSAKRNVLFMLSQSKTKLFIYDKIKNYSPAPIITQHSSIERILPINDSILFVSVMEGGMQAYDIKNAQTLTAPEIEEPFKGALFSELGDIYVLYTDHYCYLYDASSQKTFLVRKMKSEISSVSFTNGDLVIKSRESCYRSRDWQQFSQLSTATALVRMEEGHTAAVSDVHHLEEDRYLSLSGRGGCFWQLQDMQLRFLQKFPFSTSEIVEDQNLLLLYRSFYSYLGNESVHGKVRIFDLADKSVLPMGCSRHLLKNFTKRLSPIFDNGSDLLFKIFYGLIESKKLSNDEDSMEELMLFDITKKRWGTGTKIKSDDMRIEISDDGDLLYLSYRQDTETKSRVLLVYNAKLDSWTDPRLMGERFIQVATPPEGGVIYFFNKTAPIMSPGKGIPDEKKSENQSTEVFIYEVLTGNWLKSVKIENGLESIVCAPDSRMAVFIENPAKDKSALTTLSMHDIKRKRMLTPITVSGHGGKKLEVVFAADSRALFIKYFEFPSSRLQAMYQLEDQKSLSLNQVKTNHKGIISTKNKKQFFIFDQSSSEIIKYDTEVQPRLTTLSASTNIAQMFLTNDEKSAVLGGRYEQANIFQVYDITSQKLSQFISEEIKSLSNPRSKPKAVMPGYIDSLYCISNEFWVCCYSKHQSNQALLYDLIRKAGLPILKTVEKYSIMTIHLVADGLFLVGSKEFVESNETDDVLIEYCDLKEEISRVSFLVEQSPEIKNTLRKQITITPINSPDDSIVFFLTNTAVVGLFDLKHKKWLPPLPVKNTEDCINKITFTSDESIAFCYGVHDKKPIAYIYDLAKKTCVDSITGNIKDKEQEVKQLELVPRPFTSTSEFQLSFSNFYTLKPMTQIPRPPSLTTEKYPDAIVEQMAKRQIVGKQNIFFIYDKKNIWYACGVNMMGKPQIIPLKNYQFESKNLTTGLNQQHNQWTDFIIRELDLRNPISQKGIVILKDPAGILTLFDVSKCKHHRFNTQGEMVDFITISPDGKFAFIVLTRRGDYKSIIEVYDREEEKSTPFTVNQRLNCIDFSADGNIAFMKEFTTYPKSSFKVLMYYNLNKRRPIDFKGLHELEYYIELKAPSSRSLTDASSLICYGKSGACLLSLRLGCIILLKNSGITAALLTPNGNQLITGGADGVCRVWDITRLDRPLLKSCTRGLTFYANGVVVDSHTQISPGSLRALGDSQEFKAEVGKEEKSTQDHSVYEELASEPETSELGLLPFTPPTQSVSYTDSSPRLFTLAKDSLSGDQVISETISFADSSL